MALTALEIKNTKKPGYLNDGKGLYLKIAVSGARSWVYRFKLAGRSRDMGLGAYPAVSLADARERATAAREQKERGIDPIEARQAAPAAEKATMTFDRAAAEYVELQRPVWRGKRTAHKWTSTLARYASPAFGKRDVADITTDNVLRVLSPIWTTKHETASKLRIYMEAVFDYARAKKKRTAENPAIWRGDLKTLLPKFKPVVEHHPALPWQDVPAFMAELRSRDALAARAMEITILCATRTSDTIEAERSEVVGNVWVIPAKRHKTGKDSGKDHRVPLSRQAAAIFAALPTLDGSPYLFPGQRKGRPLSNMAMLMLLSRMGRRKAITVHGFRSTFRDWAAENTDVHPDLARMAIAHEVGDEVERAYRRTDLLEKRRELMQAWADYCFSGTTAVPKVVDLS